MQVLKKWRQETGFEVVTEPDEYKAKTDNFPGMVNNLRGFDQFEKSVADSSGLPAWNIGIGEIDACLPDCGLNRAGLHEIEPLRPANMPSLTGFVFGLVSRLQSSQPVIWCVTTQQVGDYGHLYAFGLERYGISPAQIVFAKVSHPLHLHFALEEALKTDGVAAVIGEGRQPDFTGSRRLSLLTRSYKTPCLLMSSESSGGRGSAALTRWQIRSIQGVEDPLDPFGPGLPTWAVALPRARGGRTMPKMEQASGLQSQRNTPYPWRVVWDEQTFSFRPVAVFSHRAFSKRPAGNETEIKTMVG